MQNIYDGDASQDESMKKTKRIFGCIIGAFVGDAAGAYLEFKHGKFTKEIVEEAL